MKIINWNLSWAGSISSKINYLQKIIFEKNFIIILQEVKPHDFATLKKEFENNSHIEYSLTYRQPGKFDTDSRKLGIVILTSSNIVVKKASVLERSILPDRTLLLDVEYNSHPLRILGLHSVTGCHHLKAKEIQYFSFAEAIDTYKPDIIGIDANEPKIDHYDISKMKFFDNYQKGNGCKTFFETMQQNDLVDAYIKNYDPKNFEEGKYLTTSHVIKRNKKSVRYDFLFINSNMFKNYTCEYDYLGAVEAGSDHAAIIVDIPNNNL